MHQLVFIRRNYEYEPVVCRFKECSDFLRRVYDDDSPFNLDDTVELVILDGRVIFSSLGFYAQSFMPDAGRRKCRSRKPRRYRRQHQPESALPKTILNIEGLYLWLSFTGRCMGEEAEFSAPLNSNHN